MRIGIDLGGTKIEGIAIDSQGQELARERLSTPAGDYDRTVHSVASLVHNLEFQTGQTASIGVGIPGALSPATGRIKNANSTCLIGKALDKDLEAILQRPVRLANDANCFALSEAFDGAARGCRVVFGVILGTGVGGGVAFDGDIARKGLNAITGEWGHNPLPWPGDDERPGPPCYCGLRGCIETFLSGSGLSLTYETLSGGKMMDAVEIAARDKDGDPLADQALTRYENQLARALATVINVLDPDAIVVGGGLSNIERLYTAVPSQWRDWVFSDTVETPLRKNKHGDSSGVRGAAWLWPA